MVSRVAWNNRKSRPVTIVTRAFFRFYLIFSVLDALTIILVLAAYLFNPISYIALHVLVFINSLSTV